MQNNKRIYERFDLALNAYLKDKSGVHELKTGNISRYGLLLLTNKPKPQRSLIQLILEFPHSNESIEAMAQVMWASADGNSDRSDGRPGMGVKFFSMPDQQRQKWEAFVEMARSGKIDAPPTPVETKKPKSEGSGIYTIGEQELEELEEIENLDLDEGEIIDMDDDWEDEEEDAAPVQDLSEALQEYEDKDGDVTIDVDSTEEDQGDIERRIYPRKPVAFLVRMHDIDEMREFFTRDISLGGMFLKTSDSKEIGELVDVVIVHPWTEQEFAIQANVQRIEQNAAGNISGMGVEFLDIDDNLRDSLLTYIESGFVIDKESDDTPIEAEVIRKIEEIEKRIQQNPIDSRLHYEIGLLYLCLSDWEQSAEHIDIAEKLGYQVPEDVVSRLKGRASD